VTGAVKRRLGRARLIYVTVKHKHKVVLHGQYDR
jgi:hypothetical protein